MRGSSVVVHDGAPDDSLAIEDDILGRGKWVKTESTRLRGFVTYAVVHDIDPHFAPSASPTPITSSGKPFNIACYVNYDKFSVRHKHILAAISKVIEPTSFKEAMLDPGW